MKGLAEGFAAGFNMAETYKRNKSERELAEAANKRADETQTTNQEFAKLRNSGLARENRLNDSYDAALSPTDGGLPSPGSTSTAPPQAAAGLSEDTPAAAPLSEDSPPDPNATPQGTQALPLRGKAPPGIKAQLDLGAVNDAALRAGKITPQQWQQGHELDRTNKFHVALGQATQKYMGMSDADMSQVLGQFSSDDSTFGQAHWVAGGANGKPGDPNPRTGKGGYAYVMVGDREPFKLNRAESAQLAGAYELMQQDPNNYDLAFQTLDHGTAKMRDLAKAYREEFDKNTAANNAATHMANTDEIGRTHAQAALARVGLERDRLNMGKFGAPMQAVGPNGEPTMMIPVTGPNGVSFQSAGLPQGYHMPKTVDGAAVQKMADSLVGTPSGELVNGKPVNFTPLTAWDAAQTKLYGRAPGAQPDVNGDASAVAQLLKGRGAPASPAAVAAPVAQPAGPARIPGPPPQYIQQGLSRAPSPAYQAWLQQYGGAYQDQMEQEAQAQEEQARRLQGYNPYQQGRVR